MASSLTLEQYLDALVSASARVAEGSGRTGLGAAVPTCPGWSVRDLLVHLGAIQRWATAHVERRQDRFDLLACEQEGSGLDDPTGWLAGAGHELHQALATAPADLATDFFLAGAPPPRLAWARRQCHEATVHAVDVQAAGLGRVPTAAETGIDPALATDGVDELLRGYLPRPRTTLRQPEPTVLEVTVTDTDAAWTVLLGEETPQTSRERAADPPHARLSGTAVGVYLGLWNRGGEITEEGVPVLPAWREQVRVV